MTSPYEEPLAWTYIKRGVLLAYRRLRSIVLEYETEPAELLSTMFTLFIGVVLLMGQIGVVPTSQTPQRQIVSEQPLVWSIFLLCIAYIRLSGLAFNLLPWRLIGTFLSFVVWSYFSIRLLILTYGALATAYSIVLCLCNFWLAYRLHRELRQGLRLNPIESPRADG